MTRHRHFQKYKLSTRHHRYTYRLLYGVAPNSRRDWLMSLPLNAVCENPQLLQRDIDKLQWYHRYVMLSGNSVCVELPEVSINPVFLCRRVDWNAKVGDGRKNRLLGIRGITVTNALASPRDVDLMCNYWHLFDWLRDSLIDRFQWQSWCWQPQSFQRCSWRIAVGKIINIVKASPRLAPLPPAASPFVSCHTVPVGPYVLTHAVGAYMYTPAQPSVTLGSRGWLPPTAIVSL